MDWLVTLFTSNSVASAALKNGATIVTDNCSVVETDGIWTLVANN